MSEQSTKDLLANLKALQEKYPEHKNVLKPLTEQVQAGNAAGVQAKLQQLKTENW